MTSILVLIPANGQPAQYILTCANPLNQSVDLLGWLTQNNIVSCSYEQYTDPNSLTPQQMYCAPQNGNVGSYIMFQCLPTPDWQSEGVVPNFTSITGTLSWLPTS